VETLCGSAPGFSELCALSQAGVSCTAPLESKQSAQRTRVSQQNSITQADQHHLYLTHPEPFTEGRYQIEDNDLRVAFLQIFEIP